MKRALAVAACVWLPCSLAAQTDEPFGLPLSGEAAEAFLRVGAGRQEEGAERRHHPLGPVHAQRRHADGAGALEDDRREQARRHQLPGRRLRGGLRGLLEARGRLLRARQARRHGARAADGRAHLRPDDRLAPALGREGDDRGRPQAEADRTSRHRGLEPPDVRRAAAAPAHVQHSTPRTSATS